MLLAKSGDDAGPSGIAGIGHQVNIRLGGLLQLLPLDLPVGRAADCFPFIGVDHALSHALSSAVVQSDRLSLSPDSTNHQRPPEDRSSIW